MKLIITLLIILLSLSGQAQTGTFTDERDGNVYQTIKIENSTWFREHLRYKTPSSYFPNFSKDTIDLRYGNYYSNSELALLCPAGWHVATIDDFEKYFKLLAGLNNIPDSFIFRSTSKNKDSSTHILIGNLNPLHDTLLRLVSTGWVEGNKLRKERSISLWITDTRNSDDKFHAHIGSLGYILHTHFHNVIDKPKRIRKFAVRCVCENK